MPKQKKSKSKPIKKPLRKTVSKRSFKSKVISFFIGVLAVIAIASLLFQYAKDNNYKNILGVQTQNSK